MTRWMLSAASAALLVGCSSGGGNSSDSNTSSQSAPTNEAPMVNAGDDQTVVSGSEVSLDATVVDNDSTPALTWTQVSGPSVTLNDPSAEDPTFTAPDVTTDTAVTLRLTADDGVNSAVSDDVVITITATELNAGYGRIVIEGQSVTLNATANLPTGNVLTWTQLEGPTVTLSDPSAEDPSFTAPTVATTQTLVFELSGEGSTGNTLTDRVTVEVFVGPDSSSDLTVLGDFSSRTDWTCTVDPAALPEVSIIDTGNEREITGNGIPAHATGTFPNMGNPNTITEQALIYFVTTSPALANAPTDMAEFGVTIDGVKLERDTAESYQNARQWSYEAITPGLANGLTNGAEFSWLGTDCNNAHVQPNGQYHYHGMMESLINRLGETNGAPDTMILGGYAADGFPFYLRYGHSDPNEPSSALTILKGSWELRSGTRPSGPGGAYDGTFREDWEYVDGSGDLDQCNGRFGVTPEYPGGTYHYIITDDYPYIPRCVSGTPDASFRAR